jgi:putative MATE family efflux protein
MRHVAVMTLTGSLGISFMFLIDMATLFWVSFLGVEHYVAAMGFAFAIQFFTISTGIGLMIAATALISRSLGRGDLEQARRQATSAAVLTFVCQSLVAAIFIYFRREILALAGAEGETLEVAARFLAIAVPSLPFMAMGMVGMAVLRAEGDALRAMMVTVSAGVVAMIVDPILIVWMDLGVDGAALGMAISRTVSAFLAVWFVVGVHDLAGRIDMAALRAFAKPFFVIAVPALLTQLSSPVGNAVATRVMADQGDGAVAGLSVAVRVGILAFGGIFALSGAIGGIIGQNYGAAHMDRVKNAYRDAILFCVLYTLSAWGLLILCAPVLVPAFNLGPEAAEVLRAFTHLTAVAYVFTGMVFVSNAAFNSLGRPIFSTVINWGRDGILMYPACILFGLYFAAPGVMYGQMAASIVTGVVAVFWGWTFVRGLARNAQSGLHPAQ